MNRIKYLRELNGELQIDLAKILDVTPVAIGNYENEKRDIPTKYLKILSRHFNCSIDYLLGKTDVKNYDKEEQEFRFAYHKEMEDLTEEEIADALRFYKEMKKKVKGNNK